MMFLSKKLFHRIFQIEVPLPNSPLGHLNSYLIKSEEENLLVDTGLDSPLAFQSLCKGISEVGVEPNELTQILATHFHVDHVGLIPRFRKLSSDIKILIHTAEAELSRVMIQEFDHYMESLRSFLSKNGAPPYIADVENFHPAFSTPQAYEELSEALPVKDGQEITVGNYKFQVKWTPGHSPGHICLYEPSLRMLVSGDHLLPTITPHIAQFMEDMNPLTDYLESLEKVAKLNVDVVLPGHEQCFINHRERIEQLKDHHKQRLAEIVHELKAGSLTTYTLASRIRWDVNYDSWNDFPIFQKYLAFGETLAHLNLLEQKEIVQKTCINKKIMYDLRDVSLKND